MSRGSTRATRARRGASQSADAPFHVWPGRALPLGVSETSKGLNFAVFSQHATSMSLLLFQSGRHEPVLEVTLDPDFHRTGEIWHVALDGISQETRYGWRADRKPVANDGFHRFDVSRVLVDPYARALSGGSRWGHRYVRTGSGNTRAERRGMMVRDEFEWGVVRPPRVPLADKVIYELHLRGFTAHPSSGVRHPGTYEGLIEKIPYLKDLGVTTVELLPVYEFDENEVERINPFTRERLRNYWGYNPLGFFAPKASYAANGVDGRQVNAFKALVREFHRAGLEVFLDVVFNHTAEGQADDDTVSFRGLDNAVYYILDPETGAYLDYSGCGNTLNCNHPVVRDLIIDALRYWVSEMHIDGFRFDLASILGRGLEGEVLANPPVLERIASDPVLAETTLIAEAWDAAGLYQVGRFPSWGRWAEWNGVFRDQVRQAVRGDAGMNGALASRLAGSADLYQASGRQPFHSINFVTCHDGFTLADLVSYERKHNLANGENNTDGADENFSHNCGWEGPTDQAAVVEMRRRRTRNLLTILLLSQGTPMLLAGDEFGRTQDGNNNAYCQDNAISWLDWRMVEANRDLHRFTKLLIAFRRAHPVLRRRDFLDGAGAPDEIADVTWHGTRLGEPAWGEGSHPVAMHLSGLHAHEPDCDVYFAINNGPEDLRFELPEPPAGRRWVRVVDTSQPSPDDIAGEGEEAELPSDVEILVRASSCVVLRSH